VLAVLGFDAFDPDFFSPRRRGTSSLCAIMPTTRASGSAAWGGRGERSRAESRRMKHSDWTQRGGTRALGGGALSCAPRTALVVILSLAGITGCAGRWFDIRPQGNTAQAPSPATGNLEGSTVAYIQGLCALPREQREPQVRALNEALLPNHANISCGRGGGGPPLRD